MWEMLYEASQHHPLSDPALRRYLDGWGRRGDAAVVALDPATGDGVGAAWYRVFAADDPGFGFVDAATPEIALATAPGWRGVGVGGTLLRALIQTAEYQGFDALSLSVRRDNLVASKLYEGHGFVRVSREGEEARSWLMRLDLSRGAS